MTLDRGLWIVSAAALALCAADFVLDPKGLLVCYLAAIVTAASVATGALGVLMMTYLVRRQWTADLHGVLTRAALLLPLFGLAFLPVIAGVTLIYPWAGEGLRNGAFQAQYLTPLFFSVRVIVYFGALSAVAIWVVWAYRRSAMTAAASGGLIVWALVVSLAGVDWVESIEPDFHSSIFGLLFAVGALLAGLNFGVLLILAANRWRAPLSTFGAIMLACLLAWAYVHAMQYWIIWSANIPKEMQWYIERLTHGWGFVLWALYLGQFVLPFMALLSERVRARRDALFVIACGTLALRYLEAVVLIVPPTGASGWTLLIGLPATLILVTTLAVLAWRSEFPEWLMQAAVDQRKREGRSVLRG